MRLLVLGGGGFLGFHVVAEAVGGDHEVTVLNRSGEPPLPGVRALAGDRRGDMSALRGQEWDAVLDTFTDPDDGAPAIGKTAALLRDVVGTYGYVSGMSVYAPDGADVPDETAPVRQKGRETDRLQERSIAKLAGEDAVREQFGDRSFFPRVGIMVGPRSTRFSYWPVRLRGAADGALPRRVLASGHPDRQVQYSDARDIAAWSITMLEAGRGGTYNTVGPGRPDTLRTVLAACTDAAGVRRLDDVELVYAPVDLLRRKLLGIDEEERPLWFPEDQIPQLAISSAKALAAGLSFRPVEQTAADCLAWARQEKQSVLTDGAFAAVETSLLALVDELHVAHRVSHDVGS